MYRNVALKLSLATHSARRFFFQLAEDNARNMVQYNARQINFTETILAINNIQQENFGDYTCRIGNNIGTKESTVHVSGK